MAALAQVPEFTLDLAGIALPASIRPAMPLTDEELIEFSRRNKPYKVELNHKGELEIMSPVGGEESYFEALVAGALAVWTGEFGGMPFGPSGGFRLADGSVLAPDAAWVRQERWAALSREEQRSYPPLCPDFIVEVLSISDSKPVLERKMQAWVANGAQLAWLLDPYAATVSIYRPGQRTEILEKPEVVVATSVVPGFQLRMARFWEPAGE